MPQPHHTTPHQTTPHHTTPDHTRPEDDLSPASLVTHTELGNFLQQNIFSKLQQQMTLSGEGDSLYHAGARKEGDDDSDLYSFDYLVSCSMMTCHCTAALQHCRTRCCMHFLMQLNFLLSQSAKHTEDQRPGQNKYGVGLAASVLPELLVIGYYNPLYYCDHFNPKPCS